MDLSPAYDAPVTRTFIGADGNPVTVEFPRLSWQDSREKGNNLKKAREAIIEARANQCHLQSWEKFRALQELDNVGVNVSAVERYAATHEGAEDITTLSANKAGISAEDQQKIWRALGATGRAILAIDLVSAANPAPAQPQAGASPLAR